MRQWLHDRPWVWIVVLLALIVSGGFVTLIIAEANKPTIVKEKTTMMDKPEQNFDRIVQSFST